MVKRTEFQYNVVRMEQGLFLGLQQLDILGIRPEYMTTALTSGTFVGPATSAWDPMNINALMVAANLAMPVNAIAVILDVTVNDDNSDAGDSYMELASVDHDAAGPYASKSCIVYSGIVDDRRAARTVIVWLSETMDILRRITAMQNFDYEIKVMGWLIGGIRISLAQWPSEELYAKFRIGATG